MIIRTEQPSDVDAIRHLLMAAFPEDDEARLVDALRGHGTVLTSIVAELADSIVGQLLFTRAFVETADGEKPVAALGPMAVAPSHQRQGIGAQMMEHGLAECRSQGEAAVVVVGHAEYYPKFGFVRADRHGLRSEFAVPPEAFMVLPLDGGTVTGSGGLVG